MSKNKIKVKKTYVSVGDPNVDKLELESSTYDHIKDVENGLYFLIDQLKSRAKNHDADKLTKLDRFYLNLISGFEQRDWLINHYELNRHHLNNNYPDDVNLIDVLEWMIDGIVAGYARSNEFYPFKIPNGILEKAFTNTVKIISENIEIENERK